MPKSSRKSFFFIFAIFLVLLLMIIGCGRSDAPQNEEGLLFHLSGDNGYSADVAGGDSNPVFMNDIELIPDGVSGKAFRCPNFEHVFTYYAAGNIYAERGTISFFWRSREPFGYTPFHILQVPYSDHSSIDMIWMRLDYNGEHGFDAFVTDANLARSRVSWSMEDTTEFFGGDDWIHFAVTWDETAGMRLYVDGTRVGAHDTTGVYYAGLDMIGMHGRLISPQCIRTELNHTRGGDMDEMRVYDRMLDDSQIRKLAGGGGIGSLEPFERTLEDERWRQEWLHRYGWEDTQNPPPKLDAPVTAVRKAEIHDIYDIKQWVWKGSDGIRETTWPNVYNRSQLPGRSDYFIEPDWDCYSLSGKHVRFLMPDEKWNHLEVQGAAYGDFSYSDTRDEYGDTGDTPLFVRGQGHERTIHRLNTPYIGGTVHFENEFQEMPIGEFQAYHVSDEPIPQGTVELAYTVQPNIAHDNPALDELTEHIEGRYLPDERQIAVAQGPRAPGVPKSETVDNPMSLVHVLIPWEYRHAGPENHRQYYSYTWENIDDGLDGIVLELPALDIEATHEGGLIPLNVQVRDPLWPIRTLHDFSFSVKPSEARTLWLDTRDRILPHGKSMYITIASASPEFGADDLAGAVVRLIFKSREDAQPEHEDDRITQVIDNWGNICECGPRSKRLHLMERCLADLHDLLRVNPGHEQGQLYDCRLNGNRPWPDFEQPKTPAGVPEWAFRQTEYLKKYREYTNWWIDERQIANGEFGGGLSDDGDFSNYLVGLALMGVDREKVSESIHRLMDAYYEQGLFTNGLCTIETDELHVYEEGISVIPQCMLLDYGNPKTVERLLDTSRALHLITDVNDRGERQISTSFFSGDFFSKESVWAVCKPFYSMLIMHAGMALVEFNGHPEQKQLQLEVDDGLLAHRIENDNGVYGLPHHIFYPSGEHVGYRSVNYCANNFWAAYTWTGDEKYLTFLDNETGHNDYDMCYRVTANTLDVLGKRDEWREGILAQAERGGSAIVRHAAWQLTGDTEYIAQQNAALLKNLSQTFHMKTDHHWWIDRVGFEVTTLQRERLGGVALSRGFTYPGHAVTWSFENPADGTNLGILIPDADSTSMTVIVHNLAGRTISGDLEGGCIEPGIWEVVRGVDTNGDNAMDRTNGTSQVRFGRTESIPVSFAPHTTTILRLNRVEPGTPYWNRADLGICADDIVLDGDAVTVTVHSLGIIDAPAAAVALVDSRGREVQRVSLDTMPGLDGYEPVATAVHFDDVSSAVLRNGGIRIDPDGEIEEITERNNYLGMR